MSDVRITGLQKHYGAVHVLKGIDLSIPAGEFTVLVGPSGCGKSTLLRTIAGLEEVETGEIAIAGQRVNEMRPRDRNIAMVFQNYALYPYLNVFENIAFGLRARKMPDTEIRSRVTSAAEMLGITGLLERLPRQLSGGQRQRVAIGRAIVRKAQLFLFDEPLSNLDAQLRDEMRGEIKKLHQELGITMIYVTHDQIEAMTLADRIVLMREGRIEQMGAPLDLYERPATRFVGGFLGSPKINFIPGDVVGDGATKALRLSDGETIPLPARAAGWSGSVILGIRPQYLGRAETGKATAGTVRFTRAIDLVQPTGSRTYLTVRVGGVDVLAETESTEAGRHGEAIDLAFDMAHAVFFDPATGMSLG
jgi:multiple sugar transport system ATP-binding protein